MSWHYFKWSRRQIKKSYVIVYIPRCTCVVNARDNERLVSIHADIFARCFHSLCIDASKQNLFLHICTRKYVYITAIYRIIFGQEKCFQVLWQLQKMTRSSNINRDCLMKYHYLVQVCVYDIDRVMLIIGIMTQTNEICVVYWYSNDCLFVTNLVYGDVILPI